MGIKGIYNEIGPGQRIALAKLAVETFEDKGRPLRLAIDISIWLFQIQSGKGGANPALRTFYYRLLRLISLAIHPLFVFDGPNKPPFKRNKRTGPNVASVPEFLAKQLLKQFGLPFHLAPGEAEAECALLQRKGVVDAVLSEDVDTLMFGSGITLRNWSPQPSTKTKVPSHVNLYDAHKTKAGAGLDREGMILVALMSGGDYVPEGIPGCGPKTACEAARAGFGADLCKIAKNDRKGFDAWKARLLNELRHNESKFFRRTHKALVVPEEFPRADILGYYTHPVVSTDDRVNKLGQTIVWDQPIDLPALRSFCADAFDWVCISGAKHFARKLAPALLVKQLRLTSEEEQPDDTYLLAKREAALVKNIYSSRQHISTDSVPEFRIGFVPLDLVTIDLDAEEPDPEITGSKADSGDEDVAGEDEANEDGAEPSSPRKVRGPMLYDPRTMQKAWIPETFVRVGVPLKVQDYEEAHRDARKYETMKALRKRNDRNPKKARPTGGMPKGALTQFTKVVKPGEIPSSGSVPMSQPVPSKESWGDKAAGPIPQSAIETVDLSGMAPVRQDVPTTQKDVSSQKPPRSTFRMPARPELLETPKKQRSQSTITELLSPSSVAVAVSEALVPSKRQLSRSQSHPITQLDLSPHASPGKITESAQQPALPQPGVEILLSPLPDTVTTRRRRSPLRQPRNGPNQQHPDAQGQTSPPPKRQSLFRMPSPTTNITNLLLPVPAETHERPTLPDPPKPTPKRNPEVITIDSSPTPPSRSVQKSISDWLVPSPSQDPPPPPSPSPAPRRHVIRLRESLNGAFALEDADADEQARSPTRRRRGARGGRTWRESEVEVLDLMAE